MDIELEQMEELVRHKVDCAVLVPLYAKVQLERASCLIAGGKGNILELALCICDLWRSKSASKYSRHELLDDFWYAHVRQYRYKSVRNLPRIAIALDRHVNLRCSVQTADGDGLSQLICRLVK